MNVILFNAIKRKLYIQVLSLHSNKRLWEIIIKMCLACSIAEGNPNAKNEKQIDYSSNQEYNSSTY